MKTEKRAHHGVRGRRQRTADAEAGRLPSCYDQWELSAKKVLDPATFSYLYAGAGDNLTSKANREAFYRCRLVPRVLRDVSVRDLSVTLFGAILPAPVLLAPVGSQRSIIPEGELASARAAASTETPFILSMAGSSTIEEVAEVMGADKVRWFQLYPCSDREVTASILNRARDNGYSAIVITVDRAAEYPRYGADMGYRAKGNAIFLSDPVFAKVERSAHGKGEAGETFFQKIRQTASFNWDQLEFVRSETHLPIILKGVLHPKDAQTAIDYGVDGIVVSNHAGRRMDGEIATLEALPAIRDVVRGRFPLMLDSGIRGGVDVVKALALGADAVLIGHLYAYALAVAGERGVRQLILNLISEIDSAIAICGCKSLDELDDSILSWQE